MLAGLVTGWLRYASPAPPRLSVVVPVYDVEDTWRLAWTGWPSRHRQLQVVIVDDGSTDGSRGDR